MGTFISDCIFLLSKISTFHLFRRSFSITFFTGTAIPDCICSHSHSSFVPTYFFTSRFTRERLFRVVFLFSLFSQFICSYVFFPIPFFMGTSIPDCRSVARLIGLKTFTNEFVAYDQLGSIIKNKQIFNGYVAGNHTDWFYKDDDLWLPSFDGGLKILRHGILEVWLVNFLPLHVHVTLSPCHIIHQKLLSRCKYLNFLAILKILKNGILEVWFACVLTTTIPPPPPVSFCFHRFIVHKKVTGRV